MQEAIINFIYLLYYNCSSYCS